MIGFTMKDKLGGLKKEEPVKKTEINDRGNPLR
jgi:hypothetical protein